MALIGFGDSNHPQQTAKRGANDEVDDRATTPEMFGPLDARFQFTIDVAAAAHNAKCERFYSIEDDGLAQSWAGERVWCNPPYSNIRPWVEKAWDSAHAFEPYRGSASFCRFCFFSGDEGWCPGGYGAPRADLVVMLLPANRTEQKWWQELVEPHRDQPGSPLRVEFLPGRPRFIRKGSTAVGPNERPPFGCCLLIWEAL